MIEGIIQKVIGKYNNNSDFPKKTQLYDIQQELIAEIKLISTDSHFGWGITKKELLQQLIGDNKE
jgi:hypothetical protein